MKSVNRARTKSGRASSCCYWSIADGEFALMAETMIVSARKAGAEVGSNEELLRIRVRWVCQVIIFARQSFDFSPMSFARQESRHVIE